MQTPAVKLRDLTSAFLRKPSKNFRVQFTSPPFGPDPINFSGTPYVGSHAVNFRNSVAYSSA
jgi:hypothetical protein